MMDAEKEKLAKESMIENALAQCIAGGELAMVVNGERVTGSVGETPLQTVKELLKTKDKSQPAYDARRERVIAVISTLGKLASLNVEVKK